MNKLKLSALAVGVALLGGAGFLLDRPAPRALRVPPVRRAPRARRARMGHKVLPARRALPE